MQTNINKIPGKKKNRFLKAFVAFLIGAAAFFLLVYAYDVNSSRTQAYKESEKIINEFIAKQLNKDPNELTAEDFDRLETLSIKGSEIRTIKPLKKLKNLNALGLSMLQISDTKPLAELENLKTLQLANFRLRDREPPKWITKLRTILRLPTGSISETKPIDLSPLKKLTKLEFLDIRNTDVRNIEILSEFHNLQHLAISKKNAPDMGIRQVQKIRTLDLKPIKGLTKLNYLELFGMPVNDIQPLVGLSDLKYLDLTYTEIKDIEPLFKLKNLEYLGLRGTPAIEQIDKLQKELPNLKIAK